MSVCFSNFAKPCITRDALRVYWSLRYETSNSGEHLLAIRTGSKFVQKFQFCGVIFVVGCGRTFMGALLRVRAPNGNETTNQSNQAGVLLLGGKKIESMEGNHW